MPSLPEALETKYGKPFFDRQIIEVTCVSLSLRGCGRFRPPSVLILAGCDIEEAGEENELRQQIEGVTELDLSKNKFKAWEEVFKILQFVPSLTFLNLSYNAFEDSCRNSFCSKFNQLGKLVLNGIGLSWKDVYSLLTLAPRVEELHLCLNGYVKVEKSSCNYRWVKRLHFNCNPITEWKQIEILGTSFPCLEILILADCPIESLGNDCRYVDLFPRLKYLSMNNCKIDSWNSIDLINRFPVLVELRLQQCPLFRHYMDDERRKLTIARLEFVQRLNGGANITEEEKETSERCFIRHYNDVNSDQTPKRYYDLVSRHGHLDPLVNVSLKPKKVVHVNIKHDEKVLKKTLSVYIKVADLKKMIAPELGLTCSHMRVFYVDKANGSAYAPEELKINNKQLYTLNVSSGDEFIIDCKLTLKEESNNETTKSGCHMQEKSEESSHIVTKKCQSSEEFCYVRDRKISGGGSPSDRKNSGGGSPSDRKISGGGSPTCNKNVANKSISDTSPRSRLRKTSTEGVASSVNRRSRKISEGSTTPSSSKINVKDCPKTGVVKSEPEPKTGSSALPNETKIIEESEKNKN